MLRVRALGGFALDLDDADIPAPGVRQRVLALLALLAGHRTPGISRDRLLAYLWPESNTAHARNSLKQTLFSLRRTVGRPVVVSYAGVLRLDPALVDVDLWRFEAALAAGQQATAVALYGGPFLDGFYVSGLAEFERWIETERARLARRHSEALGTLARRADQAGDRTSAVAWWRRLAAADPLSSTAALGFMRALEAAGDTTAALEHAARHAATVQAELGVAVANEIDAFTARLRVPAVAVTSRWRPPPTPMPFPPPPRQTPTSTQAVAASPVPQAGLPLSLPKVRWPPRWLAALLAVSAALGIAAQSWWAGREPAPVSPAESAAVAVLSFGVTGGPGVRDLAAGLENLLAARLDGADRLRSVLVPARLDRGPGRAALLDRESGAALARGASARFYVIGQLVSAGGRLQASATLYDRGNANAPVARAEAAVEETALFDLADELAAQLIAGFYRGPDERLTWVAATSTRSLPALKAYLEGGRRFRADDFAGAVDAFRQAVRADTAFALAYYRLSVAADWSGRDELAVWAARLAARFSERLSERDRALVEAYLVQREGRIDEAERRYQRIVAEYPDDAEAWFQLAEVFFHFNPLRGRSSTEARPALERVVTLNPGDREALLHLARIAALQGRRAEVDTLVRLARIGTSGSAVLDLRAFRAFALGDRPGEDQATRDLIANPGVVPAKTALTIAVRAGDLNEVENFARLLSRDSLSCQVRGLGRRMLAQAALARGLWDSAAAVLGSPEACDGAASLELRAVYQTLPFVPADRTRLRELLLELRSSRGPDPGTSPRDAAVRRYSVGLTALAVGDTVLARQVATALASPSDSGWDGALVRSLTQSLRSRLALHRGQTARALALLEGAQWERTPIPTVAEVDDRFLRAELLRQLDRDQEAAGWYRSIAERSSYELIYLAPAEYRLGQIYDHQADHSAALAHYRRFLELWRSGTETHPFITEARRRVAELQAGMAE